MPQAGGLPELSGLEKPCSDEKNDAADGRDLVQRPRAGGRRGRAGFRIVGIRLAEDREQRQAGNRANQADVRDQCHPHGAKRLWHVERGLRLSTDRAGRGIFAAQAKLPR